jgi:hypothetical protein
MKMQTQIPHDIESAIRDKVACGDYRPVDANIGPVTGAEWLALIEDEAEIQDDNAQNNHGNDATVFTAYAATLRTLAGVLRDEGFEPVKFHWQESPCSTEEDPGEN